MAKRQRSRRKSSISSALTIPKPPKGPRGQGTRARRKRPDKPMPPLLAIMVRCAPQQAVARSLMRPVVTGNAPEATEQAKPVGAMVAFARSLVRGHGA